MARSGDLEVFKELLAQQPLTISDAISLGAILAYLKRIKNLHPSKYDSAMVFKIVDDAITDSTFCISTDWRLLSLTRTVLNSPCQRVLP